MLNSTFHDENSTYEAAVDLLLKLEEDGLGMKFCDALSDDDDDPILNDTWCVITDTRYRHFRSSHARCAGLLLERLVLSFRGRKLFAAS